MTSSTRPRTSTWSGKLRLATTCAGLLLTGACCTTYDGRAIPPPAVEARVPSDPVAIANRIMAGLLFESPLADYSTPRRVRVSPAAESGGATLDPIAYELARKVHAERHLELTQGADADYTLTLQIVAEQVHADLLTPAGASVWHYQQPF